MKVYRVDYQDPDTGTCCRWFSNKRAALADIDMLKQEHGVDAEMYVVDIPSYKDGLVRWLNSRFNTDNG